MKCSRISLSLWCTVLGGATMVLGSIGPRNAWALDPYADAAATAEWSDPYDAHSPEGAYHFEYPEDTQSAGQPTGSGPAVDREESAEAYALKYGYHYATFSELYGDPNAEKSDSDSSAADSSDQENGYSSSMDDADHSDTADVNADHADYLDEYESDASYMDDADYSDEQEGETAQTDDADYSYEYESDTHYMDDVDDSAMGDTDTSETEYNDSSAMGGEGGPHWYENDAYYTDDPDNSEMDDTNASEAEDSDASATDSMDVPATEDANLSQADDEADQDADSSSDEGKHALDDEQYEPSQDSQSTYEYGDHDWFYSNAIRSNRDSAETADTGSEAVEPWTDYSRYDYGERYYQPGIADSATNEAELDSSADTGRTEIWNHYRYEYYRDVVEETRPLPPVEAEYRDNGLELFGAMPASLLTNSDRDLLRTLERLSEEPSGVRRAVLNYYLESLDSSSFEFVYDFEIGSGIEVLSLSDDVTGAAAFLAAYRLMERGELGPNEAADLLHRSLDNRSAGWREEVRAITANAYETGIFAEGAQEFGTASAENALTSAMLTAAVDSLSGAGEAVWNFTQQLVAADWHAFLMSLQSHPAAHEGSIGSEWLGL